jgi:predicted kinase
VHAVSISGVQGTGKTTLARALGSALEAVVFSRDPLMRVLAAGGIPVDADAQGQANARAKGVKGVGHLGYELQSALLRQQLEMGHSVVLECTSYEEICIKVAVAK